MTSALRELEEDISLLNKDIMNLGENENLDEAYLNLEIKIRSIIEDAESVTYREGNVNRIQEIIQSCEDLLDTLQAVYKDEINGRKDKVLKTIDEKLANLEKDVQDYNVIINESGRMESEIEFVLNELNQFDFEDDHNHDSRTMLDIRCKKIIKILENYKEQSAEGKVSISESYTTSGSDSIYSSSDEDEPNTSCLTGDIDDKNEDDYVTQTKKICIPDTFTQKIITDKTLQGQNKINKLAPEKPMSRLKVPDIFTSAEKYCCENTNTSPSGKKSPIKAIKKLNLPEVFFQTSSDIPTNVLCIKKEFELGNKPIKKLDTTNIFSSIENNETVNKIDKIKKVKKLNVPEVFFQAPSNNIQEMQPKEAKIPKEEDTITKEKIEEKNRLYKKYNLYKFFEQSTPSRNIRNMSQKSKNMTEYNEQLITIQISNMTIDNDPPCNVDTTDTNFDQCFRKNFKSDLDNLDVFEEMFSKLTANIDVNDENIDKRFNRMFRNVLK